MREVWVVESGEYDQRYVVDVYATRESAVEGIKDSYGHPYVVQWHDVEHREGCSILTGDFEHVQHYSTKHTAHYDITAMELKGVMGE